jgi:tetratricopeptide (TPR) repeat protein
MPFRVIKLPSLLTLRPSLILAMMCLAFGSQLTLGESLDQAQKAFALGNQAYEKADYDQAEKQYRRAIDEGIADHKLFYNYANALFRQNKLGLSILYWEKAAKLHPNDPDIEQNLKFARARIADKTTEAPANFLTRALWGLHSSYTINQGLWLAFGLFSALFFGIYLILVAPSWLRILGSLGVTLLALGLLALIPSLVYKIQQQENVVGAIVLKPVLEIYSGPGDNYQLLARVHEGTKFTLEQVSGDWASVKLSNGTGGWVRYAELGKI